MLFPYDRYNHAPSAGLFMSRIKGSQRYFWRRVSVRPFLFEMDWVWKQMSYLPSLFMTYLLLCSESKHQEGKSCVRKQAMGFFCAIVLVLFMGNDSDCSLHITVISWCDCECTLCLGISVCFLFTTNILLTTPPLCLSQQLGWLLEPLLLMKGF